MRRRAREAILRAASRLFYREGVRAVGVDRVAAEACVAKVSLYRHFASKDDLVVAFLEERDRSFREWFAARLGAPRSLRELVANVFAALSEWFAEEDFRGCAFVNTALELGEEVPQAKAVSRRHKEAMRAMLAAQVGRHLTGEEARVLVDALVLLMEGATVLAALGLGDASQAERVAACLLTALRGAAPS